MQMTRCIAVLIERYAVHSALWGERCKAKTHGSRPSWCGLLQFVLEEKLGLHVGYITCIAKQMSLASACAAPGRPYYYGPPW